MHAAVPSCRSPIERGRHADVAIVGGGLTGLATAVMLARRGYHVIVVERGRVGDGVTGQSTGKLTALQGFNYQRLEARHGAEVTRRYAQGTIDAIGWLTGLIHSSRLECDLEVRTAASAVRDWRLEGLVEREAAAASRAGVPVGTITRLGGAPFMTRGAVTLERQFQLDPRALVSELARVAYRLGVELFEDSPVVEVGSDGSGLRSRLANGRSLTSDWVILATQVPSPDRCLASAVYRQSRSAAIAVRPPGETTLPMLFVEGSGTVASLRDFRGLVLAVGAHHPAGHAPVCEPHQSLLREVRGWMPGATPTHRWSAQDAEVDDLLPLVGPMMFGDARVLAATGFRKWGLSSAVAAARCLAARIEGCEHPWGPIVDPWARLRRVDLGSGSRFLRRQLAVGETFVTGRLGRGETPTIRARVSGPPWRRVASFEGADGKTYRFHAQCTHLGCEVRWNDYEESWDCPCHGSRFDARTGEVLNGPAARGLSAAPDGGDNVDHPRHGREPQPGSVSPPIGASTSPL